MHSSFHNTRSTHEDAVVSLVGQEGGGGGGSSTNPSSVPPPYEVVTVLQCDRYEACKS